MAREIRARRRSWRSSSAGKAAMSPGPPAAARSAWTLAPWRRAVPAALASALSAFFALPRVALALLSRFAFFAFFAFGFPNLRFPGGPGAAVSSSASAFLRFAFLALAALPRLAALASALASLVRFAFFPFPRPASRMPGSTSTVALVRRLVRTHRACCRRRRPGREGDDRRARCGGQVDGQRAWSPVSGPARSDRRPDRRGAAVGRWLRTTRLAGCGRLARPRPHGRPPGRSVKRSAWIVSHLYSDCRPYDAM